MQVTSLHLHNFRTFLDEEIFLLPYSLLLGVNNCGKSNLIDAIRIFYEKDSMKYDESRDFPKFETKDRESWVEIEYQPSPEELSTLKSDYISQNNTFRVRKYFQSSEIDDESKSKNGIYAYINEVLSTSRFYGTKNVAQGKLGDIIYIPAVSRLDDQTKLTGPSALRELINAVFKKIVDSSPAYSDLKSAFIDFNGKVKSECTESGQSLETIEKELSSEIEEWGTSFEIKINSINPDDLVKLLLSHQINDKALGQTLDSKSYGQGFQRHLIFSLIKLSAKYNTPQRTSSDKEFSPKLTWLLFEEPEAFLHPSQIDALDVNLRTLAKTGDNQVLITTHNPEFISKNIEDIPTLIKLSRNSINSTVGQILPLKLKEIFLENQRVVAEWLVNPKLGITQEDLTEDMESIKYALWLDARRCNSFFASKVLLVEGPTETALLNYLLGCGQIPNCSGGLFILDCVGKFNIYRFMNLFGELKIPHAVLIDDDSGKYPDVDATIQKYANKFTLGIAQLPVDIENYLGISPASRRDKKPQHVMWSLQHQKIDGEKLKQIILIIQKVAQI
jgi:putative ATP-dependent endonuclease of the OLD family